MTYARIVVPLDGSSLSECALPLACALGRQGRAEILLVRVAAGAANAAPGRSPALAGTARGPAQSMPGPADAAVLPASGERLASMTEARRYLGRVVSGLAAAEVQISGHTAAGDPAEEVVRLAERGHADLIVMATHGRSGLARSVLGSVTDRVALRSTVPVLVVRPSCAPVGRPDGIGVAVRTVLVPLDQSELSESAVPHAIKVASLFRARLMLLTVVPHGAGRSQADAAQQYLMGIAARAGLLESGVGVATIAGDPKTEIPAQLELLPHTIVVMTTRGASGLTRWIRGSVTDAVIRAGLAPTMVVPPVAPILGPAIY